jgi:hypothetical protein
MKVCKFMYQNGYVRAQVVKPRLPIPPLDTIRFELKRRASGGKVVRDVIIYMRPDEAVAAAAVLLHAVWDRMVSP